MVGEAYNESYAYYSSDEDSDNHRFSNTSSRHEFQMKDDKLQFGKDLTLNADPAASVDNRTYLDSEILKKSNFSQRNFKNSFAFQKQPRFGCETVRNFKTTSEHISKSTSSDQIPSRNREIEIYEEKLLGKGSGGTCIFEGKLHGRVVAVKRMIHQHAAVANAEIEFLQKVDLHQNLLTYFHQESDSNFIYLAIEKCEGDLENMVKLMRKPFVDYQNQ